MGKIVILDELTANQIAAGEVVERPASVIKELVENSIDAGSKSITVEIKNGGVTMMKVIDNGCGLDDDDVEIAFERHATSKIRGPKDLESIGTFGFRGEALASIASVSNIELLTRPSSKDIGTLLRLSAGKVLDISPAGSSKGTSITINNLFFNTPARFKFLKKDSTEAGHVADVVSRAALGNPDIAFKFINNRAVSLHSPGNGDLKSAIFSVYGREITEHLLPLHFDNSGIKVSGFVGDAQIARGTRACQTFFINQRYVKSKIITAAMDEAHKTILMKNKYPFVVLNLEINPHLVDVNVHPQKLEVRFSDEQLIFRSIYAAVNNALLGKNYQFEQVEALPRNNELFILNPQNQSPVTSLSVELSESPSLAPDASKNSLNSLTNISDPKPDRKYQEISSHEAGVDHGDIQNSKNNSISADGELKREENAFEEKTNNEKIYNEKSYDEKIYNEKSYDEKIEKFKQLNLMETVEAVEFQGAEEYVEKPVAEKKYHGAGIFKEHYNIIGQLFKTYVIIEQEKEVLFIDQHAAHERIIFEELKEKFYQNESLSQILLLPISLEMTLKEAIYLRDNVEIFEKMGFIVGDFGHNTFLLRSLTYGLSASIDPKELFLNIFDYVLNNLSKEKYSAVMDETLYMLACKSAIKANWRLAEQEIKVLIKKLESKENPHTCPHGRPTVLRFTKYELEKLFKRIV